MNSRILWITHLLAFCHTLDINMIHSYSIYMTLEGHLRRKVMLQDMKPFTMQWPSNIWHVHNQTIKVKTCEKFLYHKRSDAAGRSDVVNIWSLCSVEELRRSFSTLTGWWSGRLHRPRVTLSWPQRWATNWFCWAGWKRPWNGTRRQWLSMRAVSLLWQVRAVWKP